MAQVREIETAVNLLAIVETADIPDAMPSGTFETREFQCRDGWKVKIFYDDGDLDYIESIIRPDGTVIDFWSWPEGTTGRSDLIYWSGKR